MGMLGDLILSARIAGVVMNFPLYDGGVSEKARRLIADGRLDDALEEYRRLAELGSGLAKCVLAYLSLRDLPRTPRDVTGAKILANAALNSEPGYANYVLAYVAAFEKNAPKAIDLMCKSHKAKFIPAASALGLILGQGYGTSKDPKKAETFLLRANFFAPHSGPNVTLSFLPARRLRPCKMDFGSPFFPFRFCLCVDLRSVFNIFCLHF